MLLSLQPQDPVNFPITSGISWTPNQLGGTLSLPPDAISNYLYFSGLDFQIPIAAVIKGVEMVVTVYEESVFHLIEDDEIRLFIGEDTLGTENKAKIPYLNGYQARTYGGEGDLWGEALTPNIVNSSFFGLGLSYRNRHTDPQGDINYVEIETVWVNVYYELNGVIKNVTSTKNLVSIKL